MRRPISHGRARARRIIVYIAAVGAVTLTAAPGQATAPHVYISHGISASANWEQPISATERVTTGAGFATWVGGEPRSGFVRKTWLSYARETWTWDGTAWRITSQEFAQAHTDLGDVITYSIGPRGATIVASATAHVQRCTGWPPNCSPTGETVQLVATWVRTERTSSRGYHMNDWWGNGCEVDFISGAVTDFDATATVTLDDVPLAPGTPVDPTTWIEIYRDVEVNHCLHAT